MKIYNLFNVILSNNQHTLVAGVTGSGKSVILNGLIYNTLMGGGKLVLIDPKIVEFNRYKRLNNIIAYGNEIQTITAALNTVVAVMYSRLEYMQQRELQFYPGEKLTVVIDEYTDLVTEHKKTIEPLLIKLLALSRAANIQIVLATQAPNRRTITSNIKLNIGQFIGLRCTSAIESKQIIDTDLLVQLPKYGTCIIKNENGLEYCKVPMYSNDEIKALIEYLQPKKLLIKTNLFKKLFKIA